MPRKPRIYLPFDSWPAEDQARWQAAFTEGDRFDGSGPGSHLAESTRRNLWISYARFLGFISANRKDLLDLRPDARVIGSLWLSTLRGVKGPAETQWLPLISTVFVVR